MYDPARPEVPPRMVPDDPQLAALGLVAALDEMPELCSIYREDGLLMALNTANERVLGADRARMVGRFNLFADPRVLGHERVAAYRRAFAGEVQVLPASRIQLQPSEHLDVTVKRPVLWLETTLVPLHRHADGRAAYVLGLSRDVTTLMQARQEIEHQRETIAALEAAHREIEAQRATIHALSTPVIEVWEGVLTLPMLGHFDAARLDRMTAQLLDAVTRTRARFAIFDLTGLAVVEQDTAAALSRVLRAVALLGARGLLAGIRPELARALAEQELALVRGAVHQDLRQALAACLHELGRA